MSIDQLWEAWRTWSELAPSSMDLFPPISREMLDARLRASDKPLPSDLRWLYERCDGAELFDGRLVIHEAPGATFSELGVPDAPAIAEAQLLSFGADGGEEEYALWIAPELGRWSEPPVLRMVEYSAESFVVGGTSAPAFLAAETVVCLLEGDLWQDGPDVDPAPVLDLLAVPPEIRALDREDESLATRIHDWADPALREAPFQWGDEVALDEDDGLIAFDAADA